MARIVEMLRDKGLDHPPVLEGKYLAGAVTLVEATTAREDGGPRPKQALAA